VEWIKKMRNVFGAGMTTVPPPLCPQWSNAAWIALVSSLTPSPFAPKLITLHCTAAIGPTSTYRPRIVLSAALCTDGMQQAAKTTEIAHHRTGDDPIAEE
jgi:hypothetical protein